MHSYKIDPDFQSCLPELSAEEYTELERDIVKNGVLSPIILWGETIVDGHNRYAICQAHHIENIPTREMNFSGKDEALEWILRNQLGRRNLNDFQRAKIALRYEGMIAVRMKERMSEGGGDRKSDNAKIGYGQMNSPDFSHTTTRKELAKIAGTSEPSIARAKTILNHGTPEQIERAEKGGKGNSVSAIAKEIREGRTEPEMRKCIRCGKMFPASMFLKTKGSENLCKKCHNADTRASQMLDFKGRKIEVPSEIKKVTEDEIVGELYNTNKVIDFTVDDFAEEFGALIKSFSDSAQRCLDMHKELLANKESKDKVLGKLSLLQTKIISWKETY